jgi:hypothetical protein
MLITSEMASHVRCCGPDGCGARQDNTGNRWCIGDSCMAWQNRIIRYAMPNGELAERPDLAGEYTPIQFGTCGHAPDPGDEPD